MRKHAGTILFAASDLGRFLECHHLTALDLVDLTTPEPRSRDTEQAAMLAEKGIEHEREVRRRLEEAIAPAVTIEDAAPLDVRAAATQEAMRRGVPLIYQAVLLDPPWHGVADFLRRVDRPSTLGAYSYEVVDAKLARSARPAHLLQLCVYSELLATAQGVPPREMALVLGDGRDLGFRVDAFVHYYRSARRGFERFVAAAPGTAPATAQDPTPGSVGPATREWALAASYPQPCPHCELCDWRHRCEVQWERDDHLSRVANIQRSQIDKLVAAGVGTVRALASLDATVRIPKLAPNTLDRLRSQARLQVERRVTGNDAIERLDPEPGRGFARLPAPDEGDVFFDIEGDPLYGDGLEYLFGLYYLKTGGDGFEDVWAHDSEQERRALERVVDFLAARFRQYPLAHVYHYNHYEATALKRLASRYGTREADVDDLLRQNRLVDLYQVVRETVRVSEPSYSLKNLETFYMEKRTEEVVTAGDSIVVYERWRQTRDPALLEQIRAYNEADCRSTYRLRSWLLELRPDGLPWPTLADDSGDARTVEKREERERITQELERRLREAGEGLLAHLLRFHRRESRPGWWAMFDRRDRTEEELVDDPECLAALELDPERPPHAEKRSTVFCYRFPAQDTKLRAGSVCREARALDRAGTIVDLEGDALRVRIKRGHGRGDLPPRLSLIPEGPLDQDVLREAIERVAVAVLAASPQYAAVRGLLRRDPPRLEGHAPGTPLVPPGADLQEAAIEAVDGLQESTLFIQGPPGAGKTYTASHVIVELMRRGQRVGVMSSSHKAIHNLLHEVEAVAAARGTQFRGVKKASADRLETSFTGRFITSVTTARDVDRSADLIAGTAWLFARRELDEVLDVLFLDEAGQISLANVVAAGTSARSIVLVGDQMQLGQPIQGAHPDGSGVSVLEHLLQDVPTIAPERGIFLATTWRMHPSLCRFISEAVYDGKLHPRPENQTQRLILWASAHPALAPAGLRFLPVEHHGCSQKSEAEADVIASVYESLLAQRYRDRHDREHAVTSENVLVVAPYNMQVHHLRHVLPAGARVGTVDKFQGLQAEVVLVSMTTSSAAELPRNVEFLYSKNRLNVAISRARCLAVVVASPALLEIACRNVDQMQLVNTLCWVRDFAATPRSGPA